MKKTSAHVIRDTPPLTRDRLIHSGADPFSVCNLCGHGLREDLGDQGPLQWAVYREHDEHDQPIAGDGALVFLALQHTECFKRLERHPRLYLEERGDPGHFPRLCGPCNWRQGTRCTHPNLKANGGPGLRVSVDTFDSIFICSRGSNRRPHVRHANRCEGFVPNEGDVGKEPSHA
jgi:hypothetical protein